MSREVTVAIVDDHARARDAAGAVVSATPGFVAVGDADSGEDALALVEHAHPDLVLMDVRLPGVSGIEAAQRIGAICPTTIVVLISANQHPEVARDPAAHGAVAFVPKEQLGPRKLRQLWDAHGSPSPEA